MADGGPPPGMSFPQKVHTEDEDFVIDLNDENMTSPPDGYGLDDRGRCKRRKRCGQCGPCQVKENCMKCHFCIRKDVLKQTCIYRKCVYLRSKPKPYNRPHQSPQGSNHMSPPREISRTSPAIKSPPAVSHHTNLSFPDQGMQMSESRGDNPFFPPHLPQQHQQQQQPMGTLQNNGYVSPPLPPMMDRTQSLPATSGTSSVNMNMQMNMSQQLQNHAISPPLQKVQEATSPIVPQPVNSPPAGIPGIPQISSCGNIPTIPPMPQVVPAIPSVLPSMSNSSLGGMPPIPAIPALPSMNDRAINEFRHPDQLQLHPHHPHFPSVPPVHPHPHMPHRETNLFGDHSRVPHMNFNPPNHMDTLSRGPSDSSCMYHPGLPYSVPGHFQPSGPSFLSGAAEMNPFRSNFLNTFPPGYSYPPDRYREGFGGLPFSRIGMASSFPQYPTQGAGYGMGNTFPQQYSAYNSQHGCPKNGSRPPVSPSTDDVKVLQEGYKNHVNKTIPKSSSSSSEDRSARSDFSEVDLLQEGREASSSSAQASSDENTLMRSIYGNGTMSRYDMCTKSTSSLSDQRSKLGWRDQRSPRPEWGDPPSGVEHLRLWHDFYQKTYERNNSVSSNNSRSSSVWEPWRMPIWFSPRRDEARSRTCSSTMSTMSSDFECEISIDDQPMNALIRSDGCNSIEIEFDNKSLTSEDFSPRKPASTSSSMSGFLSPTKNNIGFRPIEGASVSGRSLFSTYHNSGLNSVCPDITNESNMNKGFVKDVGKDTAEQMVNNSCIKRVSENTKKCKSYFKGPVCLKQDLGDEGIIQLELPGHKVSIEDIVLDEKLVKQSSNAEELKEFLRKEPDIKVVIQNEILML